MECKFFLLILSVILVLSTSCENNFKVTEKIEVHTSNEVQLSPAAATNFSNVIKNISIYGDNPFEIKKAYHIYANLLPGFYEEKDTVDYYYFRLEGDSSVVFVGAHRKQHFLIICIQYNDYLIQDESVFFPLDLNFLKKEQGITKFIITGSNTDFAKYRPVSFDKRLINKWHFDSVQEKESNLDRFVNSTVWEFQKDSVLLIDKESFNYNLYGQKLFVNSSTLKDTFYKISLSSTHLILDRYSLKSTERLFFSVYE